MKIFYMGLEPYEGRYTLQLTEWTERAFKSNSNRTSIRCTWQKLFWYESIYESCNYDEIWGSYKRRYYIF